MKAFKKVGDPPHFMVRAGGLLSHLASGKTVSFPIAIGADRLNFIYYPYKKSPNTSC